MQGQVAVEHFGTLDILAANSGGLLQCSRVIERSLLRWQLVLAKEVDPLAIRVKRVGPRLVATQVHFNGGQR